MSRVLLTAVVLLSIALSTPAQTRYDTVILNGRVIDPETGLDAISNVGIRGGTIERVTTEPLAGTRTIDARGLVVAPGFIDLHSHGQDAENYRLKALDGVTTALEMEIGVADVAAFLKEREGRALINFGATVSHPFSRVVALGGKLVPGALVPQSGPPTQTAATIEQLARMKELLGKGIDQGALGVGMGLAYTPGATQFEVIEMFRLAVARRVPVFTHVRNSIRSAGSQEPGSNVDAMAEVIGAAAISGASLHIVHMNSSGGRGAADCLSLVEGARARGIDVTTEGYPYIAGMTALNSGVFDPGWQTRIGIDYKDLMLASTGERLTKEKFDRLRASPEQNLVIIFQNTDQIVDSVILHPLVMIASDGIMTKGSGHPRAAGTYARILARYVRGQRSLTLMDAIRKMSLMPAQRLQHATPAARRKGRIQEGADADIAIFDPATVTDRSTYTSPAEPSTGFRWVLVAGTPVVSDGKIAGDVFPGRPLVSSQKQD